MAYTTNAPTSSGADFASDVIGGVNYPVVKVAYGAAGTASDVDGSSGLPVNIVAQTQALVVSDGGNSLTIDGSVAVTNALVVSDGGGSLTVDGTVAVSNAMVVSDGGGSLTIDNSVLTSFNGAINSNRVDVNIAASALQSSTKSDVSSYTSANDVMTLIGGYDGTNARAIGIDSTRNVKVSIEADNVGISGGIQHSANELFAAGDAGNLLLAIQQATGAAIVSEGRYSPLQVDGTGNLRVNVATQTGAMVVSDGGNSLTIDGSVAVTSALEVSDGGGSLTVDNNGTFATQAAGDVAHHGVDSGNPVKIGGYAKATPSASIVSDADRTDFFADLDGIQIVKEGAAHGDYVNGVASTVSVTDTAVIAAGGANIKQYITDAIIANSSATDITVDIKDGSTTKVTFPVPANGGVVHAFRTPIGGTANTAWNFSPSVNASTITCTLSGYKSRV